MWMMSKRIFIPAVLLGLVLVPNLAAAQCTNQHRVPYDCSTNTAPARTDWVAVGPAFGGSAGYTQKYSVASMLGLLNSSDLLAALGVSTPANGQLLIGNGGGFGLATLTAGSGVTITNSAGGITIAATGGGGSGVSSFNSRSGAVSLLAADVTAALGYSPVTPTSLAAVALSGSASDLSSGTLSVSRLPSSGVVAGSYTAANITVDAAGRVTAASSGSGGGGGGSPGGASGQIQYNSGGAFAGFTAAGDATINTATGQVTVLSTSGAAFSPSATTDTTNASNISTGTLAGGRLPAPTSTVLGGVKSATAGANQFATGVSTAGAVTFAQPSFTNLSGSASTAQLSTNLSAAIDSAIGSVQGDVLYRGASGWTVLAPGTSGQFLQTQGAGANPAWAAQSGNLGTVLSYVATVSTVSGASCTLGTGNTGCAAATEGDCGKMLRFSSASAVTVTVPNTLPVGCEVSLAQDGAGSVTVVAGTGTTAHSPHSFTKTAAQYSVIGIAVLTNSGGTAAVYNFVGDGG